MALTPEDGTVVAGADTIADLAFVSAWIAENVVDASAWTALDGTPTVQEARIRIANQFVIAAAEPLLSGKRVDAAQTLFLPRKNMVTVDGVCIADDDIPVDFQNAVASLTFESLSTELFQSEPVSTAAAGSTASRVKVDEIEVADQHGQGAPTASRNLLSKRFPLAWGLIRRYVDGGSSGGVSRS